MGERHRRSAGWARGVLVILSLTAAGCDPPTFGLFSTVVQLDGDLSGPAVILDAEGRALLAYADHSNGEVREVRFQRGGDAWGRFNPPVLVHSFPLEFAELVEESFRPVAIARDAVTGTLGIAMGVDGDQVVLAISDNEGEHWTSSVIQEAREGVTVLGPVLALRAGRIHLAFYRDEIRCEGAGGCSLIPEVAYYSGETIEGLAPVHPPRLPESFTYFRAPLSLSLDGSGEPALTYFLGGFDGVSWPTHLQLAYWRPDSGEAAMVTRTDAVMSQRPSASLAFQGTAPRVAYHLLYAEGTEVSSVHFSASPDGLSWEEPVPLPREEGDHTGLYQSLTFDSAGRAVVAATYVGTAGSPGPHAGPKLLRSTDLRSWTIGGPESSRELGSAGHNVTALFDEEDRLMLSFAWEPEEDAEAPLPAGIVFWREE